METENCTDNTPLCTTLDGNSFCTSDCNECAASGAECGSSFCTENNSICINHSYDGSSDNYLVEGYQYVCNQDGEWIMHPSQSYCGTGYVCDDSQTSCTCHICDEGTTNCFISEGNEYIQTCVVTGETGENGETCTRWDPTAWCGDSLNYACFITTEGSADCGQKCEILNDQACSYSDPAHMIYTCAEVDNGLLLWELAHECAEYNTTYEVCVDNGMTAECTDHPCAVGESSCEEYYNSEGVLSPYSQECLDAGSGKTYWSYTECSADICVEGNAPVENYCPSWYGCDNSSTGTERCGSINFENGVLPVVEVCTYDSLTQVYYWEISDVCDGEGEICEISTTDCQLNSGNPNSVLPYDDPENDNNPTDTSYTCDIKDLQMTINNNVLEMTLFFHSPCDISNGRQDIYLTETITGNGAILILYSTEAYLMKYEDGNYSQLENPGNFSITPMNGTISSIFYSIALADLPSVNTSESRLLVQPRVGSVNDSNYADWAPNESWAVFEW